MDDQDKIYEIELKIIQLIANCDLKLDKCLIMLGNMLVSYYFTLCIKLKIDPDLQVLIQMMEFFYAEYQEKANLNRLI